MRIAGIVLALAGLVAAQEAPAPAPTKKLADGKLTDTYWNFTFAAPELKEDELGLGGPDVLFEGTMAGGLRVEIKLIELPREIPGTDLRGFIKQQWEKQGRKLEEPVEGNDPVAHMLFVQESLAGFKRHHGYAWHTRGFHCFQVHVEANEKSAKTGPAIKTALVALKLGGDKGANFAQYAIAKQQGKALDDPHVILAAASHYLGNPEQRRPPNYPLAANLFAKARAIKEKTPDVYDAGATYALYERGGLSILSPPLRDAARAIDWHGKAEEAAKALPEEARGPSAAVSAYNIACAYALLEKIDEAFAALERSFSYTPGKPPVTREHLAQDPDLESLRSDERWKAFAEKHGMAAAAPVAPKEGPAPPPPDGG